MTWFFQKTNCEKKEKLWKRSYSVLYVMDGVYLDPELNK